MNSTTQSRLGKIKKSAKKSIKRKNGFGLDIEEEDVLAAKIPLDLLPEKGWITPASRRMGKRARIETKSQSVKVDQVISFIKKT